ncbi:MFS transporter [Priestia megaterium]|uniref:MFS transporter n=1 Tax=Priestia megaterium TaxID=1404 RepID=UPI00366F108C
MKSISMNIQIVLFFIMSMLFFVSISAFDPFISSYASDIGITPTVIGGIVGITGIASILTRLPIGILSDMFLKRKLFIQVGLLITIVCWTIAFILPNATTLYIGKISDGITGSTWVIYNVMFAAYFGKKDAAKAVAILSVASPASTLIGTTIGGLLANSYGYKFSFLIAVLAAVLALVLTFFLKEKKDYDNEDKYDIKILSEQVVDKNLWIISILATSSIMLSFGNNTFTPLVALDLGATPFMISGLSNIYGLLNGIAAALCVPFFYKRLGLINTALGGALLQAITLIAIPYSSSLILIFIFQGLAGFAMGMNFTVLVSLSIDNIVQHKQSTRMGLFQSIYSLGMFAGPVIMGILTDAFSIKTAFLVLGTFAIISSVLTKLLLKKQNKQDRHQTTDLPA